MQDVSSIGSIIAMGTEFTTGFVGMVGDTVQAFMDESVLMLFVFAIPLGMGAVKLVRHLASKRKSG